MRHHDVIEAMYLNGNTTKEISEVVRVSDSQVRNVLRQRDVTLVGRRRTGGHKINETFFRKWTPEMTYVLGFIVTDGCISGNSVIIAQKEAPILKRISDAMQTTFPVNKRSNNGNSYLHTLNISRKSIVEDLAELGVYPAKSLTQEMPDVPSEYLPHFIRGVIDGDGWVQDRGYVMNVTTASESFANALHDVFNAQGLNGRVAVDGNAYRVWVSGKQDVINLADWIYEDCGDLYLRRKYERFYVNKKAVA